MSATFRRERLSIAWLLAPPFLLFSRPTTISLCLGALLALAGLGVRAAAANHIHKDRFLAVSGPYGRVRHPLFLGSFLVGLGLVAASGWVAFLPLFLLLFAWLYGRAVQAEEAGLDERFGWRYRDYRARVPAFLPGLRRPETSGVGPDCNDAGSRTGESAAAGFPPDPHLPPAGPLRLYRRNKEWQAALGVALGFALLWGRMVVA